MGSGSLLRRAIEKYGLDNFKKEILFVFDNPEDMFAKEAEIVTEDFLSEENTYNLKVGGFGGWDFNNRETEKRLNKNKLARNSANESIKIKYGVDNCSQIESARKKISEHMKTRHKNGEAILSESFTFSGRRHSKETKQKIAEKNSASQSGVKNSQYGTIWITNGSYSKKIKSIEHIPDGWYRGRM
jgi:hypothetical protein